MKFIIKIAALTMLFSINNFSQQLSGIDKLEKLIGNWIGEGQGKPGEGEGTFSFAYDLNKNIIIRKNHTTFPATDKQSASVHDDLLIIYVDETGSLKAVYFDDEKHVINYSISLKPDEFIFISEKNSQGPRFKLVYKLLSEGKLKIGFEIAMPNDLKNFKTYLEGSAHKTN